MQSAHACLFITYGVTYGLVLFCCKYLNVASSRDRKESRKFFKDDIVLEPRGRNCAGTVFFLFLKKQIFLSTNKCFIASKVLLFNLFGTDTQGGGEQSGQKREEAGAEGRNWGNQ